MLGDLGQPGPELGRGQSCQSADVGQHRTGLLERADEILALGQIDAGLAADGGVDHRQQACGAKDEVDAAQIGRGDKPGHIAGHPSAQADDRSVAAHPGRQQAIVECTNGIQRLVLLPGGHGQNR